MRRVIVLFVLIGALGLAGCATSSPGPAATPTDNSSAGGPGLITPISIIRIGGVAGVHETLDMSADGTWVYTNAKTGANSRGQLTPDQLSSLLGLMTDPDLIQQLSRASAPAGPCADGFSYTFTFGSADTFGYVTCGPTQAPAVDALIKALADDTPF